MPLIEVKDLEIRIGDFGPTIISGLNFSIKKGEFFVVLGPNGSGKSTLVKSLNGLLIPTKGSVFIAGLKTACKENLNEIRQKIGVVFQNPENQFVSSMVKEDVAFGPRNLGFNQKEIDSRVNYALSLVEMLKFKDSMIHELSGGQKQKIAIAGVLAMTPEIMVLDEPSSMLDPQSRTNLLNLLKKLNKNEKITIILVTHYTNEVFFADKFFILNNGKIAFFGRPEKLLDLIEKIKELNLEFPDITELNYELHRYGFSLSDDIRTPEKCAKEIINQFYPRI